MARDAGRRRRRGRALRRSQPDLRPDLGALLPARRRPARARARPGRPRRHREPELPSLPGGLPGRARRRDGDRPAQPAPQPRRIALRAGGLRRARAAGGHPGRGHPTGRRARDRPRRRLRGAAGRRRAGRRGPRRRGSRRAGRPLLHRRHDRRLQGRDAQPREPARQHAALPGGLALRGRHGVAGGRPAVPRGRLDRRAGDRVGRGPARPLAGVRPRGGARPDRARGRDGDGRRADHARGAGRGAARPAARRLDARADLPRWRAGGHGDAAARSRRLPGRRADAHLRRDRDGADRHRAAARGADPRHPAGPLVRPARARRRHRRRGAGRRARARRRGRRGPDPRRQRDGGLLAQAGADGGRAARTAGTARATSASSTTTPSCTWSTGPRT